MVAAASAMVYNALKAAVLYSCRCRMEFEFEEFVGRRARSGSSEPRVALYKGVTFNLNQRAFEALGSPARVVFGFDTKRRAVGIRAERDGDTTAHAYPLQSPDASKSSHYV